MSAQRICPKCGLIMKSGCYCAECGSKTVKLGELNGNNEKELKKTECSLLVNAKNIKDLLRMNLNKDSVIWLAGIAITIIITIIIIISICINPEKSKKADVLQNTAPEIFTDGVPDALRALSKEKYEDFETEIYGEVADPPDNRETYQQSYAGVYDKAGLLSDSDEALISMKLMELQDKTEWDAYFAATDEMVGNSIKESAELLYNEVSGGHSGICIMIDINSFDVYIGAYEGAEECLTDNKRSHILEASYYLLEAENYADYITAVVSEIDICYENNKNDSILPFSDSAYLTENDLEGFDQKELRLARNEIYARHGRLFDDEEIKEYFNSKSWYHGEVEAENFQEEWLNEYETANRDLIIQYEQQKGYR